MTITENKTPTEILIRYAEDGSIAGAHVAFLEIVLRDGAELSRKIAGPYPLGSVEFPTEVVLDQALVDALATIETLTAKNAALEKQITDGPQMPKLAAGEVTMRQARLALMQSGVLPAVQPAIDALPEPDRTAANIEWEYSQTVERNRPFVLLLGGALGLNDTQLDDLFALAATL